MLIMNHTLNLGVEREVKSLGYIGMEVVFILSNKIDNNQEEEYNNQERKKSFEGFEF